MFDRFKKPTPGEGQERPRDASETRPAAGGFGRRQTPVGGSATPEPPPSSVAPSGGFGKRAAPSKAAEPENPGASDSTPPGTRSVEVSTVVPKQIADWLMAELRDGRGVHCETILTVLGALAGFAAQQAVWGAAIATGAKPTQAFTIIRTKSGESFYFGEPTNHLLASTKTGTVSVWQFVAGAAVKAGATSLPDLMEMFSHTSKVVGSDQFGIPRLPPGNMPRFMPRGAMHRYWAKARIIVEQMPAGQWPMLLAIAAGQLIVAMKEACAPDLACRIFMEAAIPMSKVDPATVPKRATH